MDGAQQETMLSISAKAREQAHDIAAAMRVAIREIEHSELAGNIRDEWLGKVAESVGRFTHSCDTFEVSTEAEIREFIEKLKYFISETSDEQKLAYFVDQLANRYADRLEPAFTKFADAQLAFEGSLEESAREYQNSALKSFLVGSTISLASGGMAVSLASGGMAVRLLSLVTSDEYWASRADGQSGRQVGFGEVANMGALSLMSLWLTVQLGLKYFQVRAVDVAEIIDQAKNPSGYGFHESY
ncbi:MAG: hypothetical protein H0T78_03715 [Longispora sp.]|nr:hypothetical protein [Longispora sp. (in: high G+C Gram-positive bacteria)]